MVSVEAEAAHLDRGPVPQMAQEADLRNLLDRLDSDEAFSNVYAREAQLINLRSAGVQISRTPSLSSQDAINPRSIATIEGTQHGSVGVMDADEAWAQQKAPKGTVMKQSIPAPADIRDSEKTTASVEALEAASIALARQLSEDPEDLEWQDMKRKRRL